ncbi:MAG: hypothetical protein H7222_15850 [Methylotenera sp.]|nr:hypothetical protein [Oligoflexia bacterium]
MNMNKFSGKNGLFLILSFLTLLQSSAHACSPADVEFVWCSVTIGSDDEISAIRVAAGADPMSWSGVMPLPSGGNSTIPSGFMNAANNYSRDCKIYFHEYVNKDDPWDYSRMTYNWHNSMMNQGIPGLPGKRCSGLTVSGHHDANNAVGGDLDRVSPINALVTPATLPHDYDFYLKRNQYVYSDRHYLYEMNFPKKPDPRSTPVPYFNPYDFPESMKSTSFQPGPRLLLADLARSAPVCNNPLELNPPAMKVLNVNGQTQTVPKYPLRTATQTWKPNTTGDTLLGDLLVTFLFACNLDAKYFDPKTHKMIAGNANVPAVSLPALTRNEETNPINTGQIRSELKDEKIHMKTFYFEQRAQVLFPSHVLYGFPDISPLGSTNGARVTTFLTTLLKPKFPSSGLNYLTDYLRCVAELKSGGAHPHCPPEGAQIQAGAGTTLACFDPRNLACKCVKTSGTGASLGTSCVQECSAPPLTAGIVRNQYCKGLQKWYTYWQSGSRSDQYVMQRRRQLLQSFLNGPEARPPLNASGDWWKGAMQYDNISSDYDIYWLF